MAFYDDDDVLMLALKKVSSAKHILTKYIVFFRAGLDKARDWPQLELR